jgi:transposase
MQGFVQGADRQQATLLPECLDDWVDESNSIRAVDVFVDALDLRDLGFDGVDPAATGRPAYHPSPMLKLYIYGYLNRVQSSRRLEREAGRNLEVMWLTRRLAPDHKTIADFRKDNGPAIKKVCAQCMRNSLQEVSKLLEARLDLAIISNRIAPEQSLSAMEQVGDPETEEESRCGRTWRNPTGRTGCRATPAIQRRSTSPRRLARPTIGAGSRQYRFDSRRRSTCTFRSADRQGFQSSHRRRDWRCRPR